MPELPEVETIRQDLIKKIIGKKILEAEILTEMIIKRPSRKEFEKIIQNKIISDINRRGKYLILTLDPDYFIVMHLKLTGVLIYQPREKSLFKETRVIFHLNDDHNLLFNDQRKFGEINLVKDPLELKGIAKLGPEPFSEDFTIAKFKKNIATKSTRIKSLLLDQTFLAGIGNIYANEALFFAGIDPQKKAREIPEEKVSLLYEGIKKILKQAIQSRGSSIDNYRDLNGNKGGFEKKLLVYGRTGEPCPKCKNKIVRTVIGGRGTFHCPSCQK